MKRFLATILTAATLCGAVFAQTGQLETVSAQKGIQTNGIKRFQINLKSENIKIEENKDASDKSISVEILSNYTAAYPMFTNDGKVIKIEQKENTNKLKDRVCYVNISIPKDFTVQEFKASTDSANIDISDFHSQRMEVSTTTGQIKFNNVESIELNVRADRGSVNAKNVKLDRNVKIESSSGDLIFNGLQAEEITADSQKGTMRFTDVRGKKLTFNADKGVLELTLANLFERDSLIRVSSGTAKIYVPSSAVFWTTGQVDRGRFRSEFSQDSKGPRMEVRVGGGDLQIIKD